MNEGVEEPKTEEMLPALAEEGVPPPETPWSGPSWLRLIYIFEFLIAPVPIFMVWSQVGGQGHLDLLPWYVKLAGGLGLSWCCVRLTAAIVEHPKAWNRHSVAWLAGLVLIAGAMAGITYYYHLHELPDEQDENTPATSASVKAPRVFLSSRDRTSG